MSTLRINNIEAQSIPASPTLDEKVKITNSSGDILVNIDGKTSGITTIGINTTDGNIKFDENSNVVVTGVVTATKFSGDFEPVHVNASGIVTASSFVGTGVSVVGVVTATSFVGSGSQLTGISAGTSLSGSTNDTICTVTGANAIQGEANLTFTGSQLNVTGNISLPDSVAPDYVGNIYVGSSSDLKIFHNGSDNFIRSGAGNANIRIDNNSGVLGARFIPAGSSELYHNGRLRAYTVSNGFYAEQGEVNDDFDLLIANKFGSLSNNQRCAITCRVTKDAGGSHGGTNRQAVFGHMYNSSTGGGGYYNIRSNDGTNRDFYMDNNTNLRVNYGNSNIGSSNGTVVGSQSSDIRNKNLVGDGTVSYGLSEVLQLNPIKYQYKKELVDRIGFSAQQVEPIIPESVYDTKQDQDNEGNAVSGDTIKAMYYVDLIPVLVNAIKELKAENDALKKRLDDGGL